MASQTTATIGNQTQLGLTMDLNQLQLAHNKCHLYFDDRLAFLQKDSNFRCFLVELEEKLEKAYEVLDWWLFVNHYRKGNSFEMTLVDVFEIYYDGVFIGPHNEMKTIMMKDVKAYSQSMKLTKCDRFRLVRHQMTKAKMIEDPNSLYGISLTIVLSKTKQNLAFIENVWSATSSFYEKTLSSGIRNVELEENILVPTFGCMFPYF